MRILTFITLIVLSVVAGWSQAPQQLYDFKDGDLHYRIRHDNTVSVSAVSVYETTYTTNQVYGTVHIPNTAYNSATGNYYDVVSIDEHAFENQKGITAVDMTSKITSVGEKAFYGCSNLKLIVIKTESGMWEDTETRLEPLSFANISEWVSVCIGNLKVSMTPDYKGSNNNAFAFGGHLTQGTIKVYVPDTSRYEYNSFGEGIHVFPYGTVSGLTTTYNGGTPVFNPTFETYLPFITTVSSPMIWDSNVGSSSCNVLVNFVTGDPHYISFGVSIPATYTINPAPLVISTGEYEREYGEENPEIALSVSGYLNWDNENVFSTKPRVVNGESDWWPALPDKTSKPGRYPIHVYASLSNQNYKIVYNSGAVTVNKAHQTISWDLGKTDFMEGENIAPTATASSGLQVEYSSSDDAIAKVNTDGTISFLKEGSVTITATQTGDDNYLAATPVEYNIEVSAKPNSELAINSVEENLSAGQAFQLVITDYKWESSDETVATVSEAGLVTAISKGNAIITLSRKSDGTTLAACSISVNEIVSGLA